VITGENMRVSVVGNLRKIENCVQEWNAHWKRVSVEPVPIQYSGRVTVPFKSVAGRLFMLQMDSLENSFAQFVVKCPSSFDHPDIAALLVLDEYLTTMEGLFWKQVRGNGLAYGASLRIDIEAGFITFVVYRSQNSKDAYEAVCQILRDLKQGTIQFEQAFLDAAKSSVLYGLIERSKNVSDAAEEAFVNSVMKCTGVDANKTLMQQVQRVQLKDLQHILLDYLMAFVSSSETVGFVTCAPGLTKALTDGFAKQGFRVQAME
jgi:Zn-dependent M16 (insulinase) family peptidase